MDNLRNSNKNIEQLFTGIRALGKPSKNLLEMFVQLAFNKEREEIVLAKVIVHLLGWIKDMNESEQIFVCDLLSKICCKNLCWYGY